MDVPGYPLHVVARGVNRGACFLEDRDFATYRAWLFEAAARHESQVHAFVLMTNHVHLLLTGRVEGAVSRTMQWLGARYVRYFNDRRLRTGTLFEGRFHASLVQSDRYVLGCIRYIELNPVRAGMVDRPVSYPWSSCAAHALGQPMAGWTPHATYLALATRDAERARAYRQLLDEPMAPALTATIRDRLNGNRVLADA